MKKIVIIATVALFFGSMLTSCKSHGNCAGMTTQAEKVKVSNAPRPL